MVVDKDVEGLGEWTLGEVKTEWVRTLTVLLFRWKTQSRGYVCKIGQLPDWCRTFSCWPPSVLVSRGHTPFRKRGKGSGNFRYTSLLPRNLISYATSALRKC